MLSLRPKSKNRRCKKQRFIDSDGVPHVLGEGGDVFGADGSWLRERVQFGSCVFGPGDEDGAMDVRALGPGTHHIRWDSGIQTRIIVVEETVNGAVRRKVVTAPYDAARVGQRGKVEPGVELPAVEPGVPVQYPRISRSLRRKIDRAYERRAEVVRNEAASLRRKSEAEVAKAVRAGVGSEDLIAVMARMSDEELIRAREQTWSGSFPFDELRKAKNHIREAYDAELEARMLDRQARNDHDGGVWARVWAAKIDGMSDSAIVATLSAGKELSIAAARTSLREPFHGPVDFVKEMVAFETYNDAALAGARDGGGWAPFDDDDVKVMYDRDIKPRDSWQWWRIGARSAEDIRRLRVAGIYLSLATDYAKVGLSVDDMIECAQAGITPTDAERRAQARLRQGR